MSNVQGESRGGGAAASHHHQQQHHHLNAMHRYMFRTAGATNGDDAGPHETGKVDGDDSSLSSMMNGIGGREGGGFQKMRKYSHSSLRRKAKTVSMAFFAAVVAVSIGVVLITLTLSVLVRPLHLTGGCAGIHQGESVDISSRHESIGVMYICWGGGCDADLVCASVTSLRRAGGWQGKVYVVTDDPERLDAHRETYCFGNDVVQKGYGPLYQTVRAPEAEHQMLMKDWKRRMFELLPDELATTIYVDADNFVVACFESFLMRFVYRDAAGAGGAGPAYDFKEGQDDGRIFMLPDNVCLGCNVYNGGFMVVNKGTRSSACLDAWLEETAKGDHKMYKKDQVALDAILSRPNNACTDAIVEIPSREELYMDYLLLPALFRLFTTHRNPTMQHFTSGIRKSWIWPHIVRSAEAQINAITEF